MQFWKEFFNVIDGIDITIVNVYQTEITKYI